MAPHSSTLAWKIPGTRELGGLPSMGLHRVGHEWSDLAAAAAAKNSTSALLTVPKPLTVWITINCGKFLKKMGIPDHLTSLLRNLYAGQEAAVRTWNNGLVQIRKGVYEACIKSPWLFTSTEYIMKNVGLDEAQAGIKFAEKKIKNLRYADDTTLWQKAKWNPRPSWWRWKRRVKKLP